MIKDAHLLFSALQAATDATGASTNVIDMTKAGDAVAGAELYLVVRIGTAIDSSGHGASLNIALESDSVEDFSTNSTKIVHVSKTFAQAALTVNTIVWKIKLPPGLQRYIRLYYTESGEAITSGTIDAFLTPDVNIA
ncbi:MAG: hypothetical protein C4540_04620 [Candidatus Omnitrophota bacterium]|jgi:hypothetical protein|nr:MAG: hypothetical protein C4540_04620 [Candidatus Omnitrophota bacterium]